MRSRTKIRRVRGPVAAACAAALLGACSASDGEPATPETAARPAARETATETAPPAGGGAAPEAGATHDPDEVLVTVNGEPITAGEVDESFRSSYRNQLGGMPPEQVENMRSMLEQQIVERLVSEALLRQEVEEADVEVADEEVQGFLDDMLGELPEGVGLEGYLANVGLEEDELRERIRFKLAADRYFDTVVFADLPEPGEEEVTGFYAENPRLFEVEEEEVEARHILVEIDADADEEARAAAEAEAGELRAKLVDEGVGFADLARAESDCPSSAQGGDLGRFGRGRMVPPFEEAAFSLEVDQISPVVETRFGYHIIQVTDHDQAGRTPLEEVRDSIRMRLLEEKKRAKIEELVAGLREEAQIVYPDAAGTQGTTAG